MFDNVCTLPLTSELFTQVIHPSEPILAVGLSAGHVQTFRLPANDDGDDGGSEADSGFGKVVTEWRTRRHKGSCRSLAFSVDGEALYSAGTDGILKAASSSTGQVTSKIALPLDRVSSKPEQPSLIHALSPQTLLVATDSSALCLYDLRIAPAPLVPNQKPQQTHHPHEDYVSSITPLPPSDASTNGFSKQWVTTGATTLAVTDLRRGVIARSEDQEDELLSSIFVSGLPAKHGRSTGEKVLVGDAGGVLTVWERGDWVDQGERIVIDRGIGRGQTIDALAVLPDDLASLPGKHVAVGMGDGSIKILRLGSAKGASELSHDDIEGVVSLGVDVGHRLISGGGQVVKIWVPRDKAQYEEDAIGTKKRGLGDGGNSSEASEEEDEAESEDEVTKRKRRKKRKRKRKGDKDGEKGLFDFKEID